MSGVAVFEPGVAGLSQIVVSFQAVLALALGLCLDERGSGTPALNIGSFHAVILGAAGQYKRHTTEKWTGVQETFRSKPIWNFTGISLESLILQAGCHALASDWRVPLLGLAVAAFESSMSLA